LKVLWLFVFKNGVQFLAKGLEIINGINDNSKREPGIVMKSGKKVAFSRCSAARKTLSERKIGEKRGETKCFSPIFSFAGFRAAPPTDRTPGRG